jgi:hypothetical protein
MIEGIIISILMVLAAFIATFGIFYLYLLTLGKKDKMKPYVSFKGGFEMGLIEREEDKDVRVGKIKEALSLCEENGLELYEFEQAPDWLNKDLCMPKGSGHLSIISPNGKRLNIRDRDGVKAWFDISKTDRKIIFKGLGIEKMIRGLPVVNLKNYYIGLEQ